MWELLNVENQQMDSNKIVHDDQLNEVWVGFTVVKIVQIMLFQGFFLFKGADWVSEGSQMLLLTPYKKIIGTIVIPILGAVPEGFMVLFSAIGGNTGSIGMGTLAGSSIMLLTVNWMVVALAGRVDSDRKGVLQQESRDKLTRKWDFIYSGCENSDEIKKGTWQLILSVIPLVIIELGCIGGSLSKGSTRDDLFVPILIAIAVTVVLFVAQVVQCLREIKNEFELGTQVLSLAHNSGNNSVDEVADKLFKKQSNGQHIPKEKAELIMSSLFRDKVSFMQKLHEVNSSKFSRVSLNQVLKIQVEDNQTPKIALNPLYKFQIENHDSQPLDLEADDLQPVETTNDQHRFDSEKGEVQKEGQDDEDLEEEELIPEDLKDLPQASQQWWINAKAFWYMLSGLLLVMVFSDPVVATFEAMGDALGVDPFQVAFFLAPLASNAEELVVTYNQASKKTRESQSIAVNALQGCSCMNTTQCFFIFLVVLALNEDMVWNQHAETLVLVCFIVFMALLFRKQNIWAYDAFFIGSLQIISIILIAVLKMYVESA